MTEFPKEWVACKISDFSHIVMGQSPASSTYNSDEIGLPFYQGKAEFGDLYPEPVKYCNAPKKIAEKGSTLLSVRAPVGPTNIAPHRSCIGRGLAGIHPLGGVPDRFILYLFRGYEPVLSGQGKGTTFKAITKDFLFDLSFALPPLSEQVCILEEIEALFSDLDNAIENLKSARVQLKVYRQAVLKYAFTGKLSNYGNIWETKPLGQACQVVSGNTPKGVNEIYSMGEIPFYKVSDMNTEGNEVYLKKSKINLSPNDCKKLKLKTYPAGTVVFPKRGGAILTNKKRILSKESAFDLNLMGVVPNDNVLERFLFNWFLLLDLGKLCDGSNVPQINHGDIEPLDFPFVPTEIQKKVIVEIETRLSVCKNMEDALDENLCKAEALRQSILKQAFEGKLTEQWRKDHKDLISGVNSAEALLVKIKAEKEALQVKLKGKTNHD